MRTPRPQSNNSQSEPFVVFSSLRTGSRLTANLSNSGTGSLFAGYVFSEQITTFLANFYRIDRENCHTVN